MKTIEQLLASGDAFRVDSAACMQHADILKPFRPELKKESWNAHPVAIQLVFKVAFISICHQFNWDFLQEKLSVHLLENPDDIVPALGKVTAPMISDWLASYPKQERVRPKERAALLRNVSKVLTNDFNADPIDFYKTCSMTKLDGKEFQQVMDRFEGYRTDKLRKKTNILSHDLLREGIIEFPDPENLEPAIDYHIMRLYLRTGRVLPTDRAVFRYLEGAPNPRGSLVRELRRVTAEAAKLTSFYSGVSIADLNFVEWQIGRSVCLNDEPRCDAPKESLELAPDVCLLAKVGCPYRQVCLSRNQLPSFMAFEEPNYVSSDY